MHFLLGSKKVFSQPYLERKHARRREEINKLTPVKQPRKIEAYIIFLRQQRLRAGIKQQELASILRTKQSAVSRFECGLTSPSLSFLERYARAIGVNIVVTIRLDKS